MPINLARINAGIASLAARVFGMARGGGKSQLAKSAAQAQADADKVQAGYRFFRRGKRHTKPAFDRAHANRRNWLALQSRRRNRKVA